MGKNTCLAVLLPTLLSASLFVRRADAAIAFPPQFGNQSFDNRYRAKFVSVYSADFESGWCGIVPAWGCDVRLTSDPAERIAGAQSVRLSGAVSSFQIPAARLNLEVGKVYEIAFDYKILAAGPCLCPVALSVQWTGLPPEQEGLGGPLNGLSPLEGHDGRAIRIGGADARITFYATSATVVLDNVTVRRHEAEVYRAEIPLVRAAFPRVGNYNLNSPLATAHRTRVPLDSIMELLALCDLVNGVEIDHTFGPAGWVAELRAANPNLILLPYHQSFIAQYLAEPAIGGVAKLRPLFNQGLQDSWFMYAPNGQRMIEPLYPQNVQMNHTRLSPPVDGWTFNQYVNRYLSQTVFPSGLWDGIHFDQPEWYPNPLLSAVRDGPIPPIDLDRDGVAETTHVLYARWHEGFRDYFSLLADTVGQGRLFFGNSGYLCRNRAVLHYLNGWQAEILSPYGILPNGDWDTNSPSHWYQFFANYRIACDYARAPQLISIEATGHSLGTPTGTMTDNGLPDRLPVLEPRDFRRMRLGLATALMDNGFFEYEYVDNSSPPVWFDEYAVNAAGIADKHPASKGYLGQPLNDAVELSYPQETVVAVDFESSIPPGVLIGPKGQISSNPSEVIAGQYSLAYETTDVDMSAIVWMTLPASIVLGPGETYQLTIEFKILRYSPKRFGNLIGIGFTDSFAGAANVYRTTSLYYPDIEGTGQTGILRAAAKIPGPGYFAFVALNDTSRIAVDNVRLVRGTGGVFRRDFERGVVLVNPTPEDQTVSLVALRGPLHRTGLRRIAGSQAPTVNNGQAVTGDLILPRADGLILLADRIAAASPTAPTSVISHATTSTISLAWAASGGAAAGYVIEYGEAASQAFTRSAAVGPRPEAVLTHLQPGTLYEIRIAAYDFRGRLGPWGQTFRKMTAGTALSNRPFLNPWRPLPALQPGGRVTLYGSNLSAATLTAGGPPYPTQLGATCLLINGLPSPIQSVGPYFIRAIAPAEIAGTTAIVRLLRDSVPSPDLLLPIGAGVPSLQTRRWDIYR